MLAEEAAAVDAGEIVGRRELAILGERDAQHGLELRDAPRGGEARVELARGGPAADALVRAGGETGLATGGVVQRRHVQDERRAPPGAPPHAPHPLEPIGPDPRTGLPLETAP